MRSVWIRGLESVAILVFVALFATLAWHLESSLRLGSNLARIWIELAGLLIGYLCGDLLSGLAHWFCDNFFLEDSPIIGSLLIKPFREHHRDPAGITTHGFLELTGNSCLAMLPVLGAGYWWRSSFSPLWETALLMTCASLFATNLVHKWAHASIVPGPVRWLQRRGLILK